MLKAVFYCNIQNPDGEIINEDFDFDEGTFPDKASLVQYCKSSGYIIGEPCGSWGDDVGILTDIVYDEI